MRNLVLSVLAIVFLMIVLSVISLGYRYFTAEIRGIVGQHETVHSPLHRLGAYNHFYDLCTAIQGHEATLASAKKQLDQTTDPKEQTRIRANIAGIEAQRARSIARYNNDARKDYSIGQFRDSNLPYSLDVKREETTC